MGYQFREFEIPDRMMNGIDNYVNHRLEPGGFLSAIIENNLVSAIFRADDENIRNIPAYVAYFYNEVPSVCWGSREKMKEWLNGQK